MNRRSFLLAALFRSKHEAFMGIPFFVERNGRSPIRYLHVHGDEPTAREVLREHMKTHKGTAYLVDNDQRSVAAGSGRLDPNRMFSREGAEKNLRALNPAMSDADRTAILDRLDHERPRFLKALFPPKGGLLVALHNNRGYSINDELPISDEKALNAPADTHEFFLATNPDDFRMIAKSPYNVVLQKDGPKEDDGSLSRLTARRGVRYVNLECGLGKAEAQRTMVDWLVRNLPATR